MAYSVELNSANWREFLEVYNNVDDYPTIDAVAAILGCTAKNVVNKAAYYRRLVKENPLAKQIITRNGANSKVASDETYRAVTTIVPSEDEPIEDLIERALEISERKKINNASKSCIDIKVKFEGPYGVVGIPDNHMDNPGTELKRMLKDAEMIREHPHLFAVAIGDGIDNFIVGKLEKVRRGQQIKLSDSWRMQEYYVDIIADKLIAAIGGNHNDWSKDMSGLDPLADIFENRGLGNIYDADQIRVRLTSPNGKSFTHMARHKYKGASRFHSIHGIMIHMLEKWEGEDVFWGGHIHQASHAAIQRNWEGSARAVHGVQLGAYKVIDEYAKREGFRANQPFLTPMIIHIPETGETIFVDDINRGVQFLKIIRKELGYTQ